MCKDKECLYIVNECLVWGWVVEGGGGEGEGLPEILVHLFLFTYLHNLFPHLHQAKFTVKETASKKIKGQSL
jgi:hypothetical protein